MNPIPIIGLPVHPVTYQTAVDWILEKATLRDQPYAVEAANTHVAALTKQDPEFHAAMQKFDLICPDGMPLIWILNTHLTKNQKLTDRVYGPTLMLRTIQRSANQPQHSHFLLGGKTSTLEKLTARFQLEHPSAKIAGTYSPPFGHWDENENQNIIQKIRESGANLVWVGLGCPKQEKWIAANKHRLPPAIYFGIGAAFAFHAGEVTQAPNFIQKLGMEWLFRLLMEPRRLFKRYLTYNSLFLYHLIKTHTQQS